MQGKVVKGRKKLAATPNYVSPAQLKLEGFDSPFERRLNKNNRWVRLAEAIPWDKIVPIYDRTFRSAEARPPISGRVIIGAMIIKHIESFTDRDTVQHITENMYMQYFLGYSSFTDEPPFTAPLFVAIRKRMTLELTGKINDVIVKHCMEVGQDSQPEGHAPISNEGNREDTGSAGYGGEQDAVLSVSPLAHNKGKLLMDATVAPQHITFPTDLKVLDAARRKSEELIDLLYSPALHGPVKPRTYRKVARKLFLGTAKKKAKSAKAIYRANGS